MALTLVARRLSLGASSFLTASGSYTALPIDDRRRQRQPLDAIEDRCEQPPRHSHFRQLERLIFRMPRYLRPDLDEFLS